MITMTTLRTVALAVSVFAGVLGVGAYAQTDSGPSEYTAIKALNEPETDRRHDTSDAAEDAAQTCAVEEPEIGAEEFARTELYFGTARPDGTAVTEAEWRGFLDEEITPRFPAGLTVMTAMGQWQEEDGDVVQEQSQVVILLYPREFAVESGAEIEAIRTAYEETFQQESVLRADDDAAPVCVSF